MNAQVKKRNARAKRRFPRARRNELAAAFVYARIHPPYHCFAPPDDSLKLDLVALHIIDDEVARRREEEFEAGRKSNLAFLVGTTVRDLFGHKKTRRKLSLEEQVRAREIEGLIKAYEGLMMKIFADRRKESHRGLRNGDESHPIEDRDQFRLT